MVLKNLDKHPRQVTFLANSGRFNLPFSNALEAAIFDIDIILVPNPSPTIRSSSPPIGSLRYGDYGLRTTAGRALSFVRSTGLSRANIER